MRSPARPAGAILGAVLLAGCSGGSSTTASTSTTPTPSNTATTPTRSAPPAPTSAGTATSAEPSPADPYPDPAELVGKELYFESWPGVGFVVGGERIGGISDVVGNCVRGTGSDACSFAVSAVQPVDADGTPRPSSTALLLLMASAGRDADRPLWTVLDARVVDLGAVTLVAPCVGHEGVVIVPSRASGATVPGTVPVARAWGPDEGYTTIVAVDPASLSCDFQGD
jgi:hypothetical protein